MIRQWPPVTSRAAVVQPMPSLLAIIHEDAELLVVNKPAGLVCHPTKGDAWSSLISRARLYLNGASPQLINRLDRETSGLVLLAKSPTSARELRRLWEVRAVRKEYLAIVEGRVTEDAGVIEAPLGKDESSRVAIKDCVRSDGSPARTEFKVEKRFERQGALFTRLRITPHTGRKHQIRIHLAHRGHPIVGDKLYGADEDCYLALVEDRMTDRHRELLRLRFHALHAWKVVFPWRDQDWEFEVPPEAWFEEFCGEGESVLPVSSAAL
jgi:23S rRNA pseudouridine1911/1915/1917 synthase